MYKKSNQKCPKKFCLLSLQNSHMKAMILGGQPPPPLPEYWGEGQWPPWPPLFCSYSTVELELTYPAWNSINIHCYPFELVNLKASPCYGYHSTTAHTSNLRSHAVNICTNIHGRNICHTICRESRPIMLLQQKKVTDNEYSKASTARKPREYTMTSYLQPPVFSLVYRLEWPLFLIL